MDRSSFVVLLIGIVIFFIITMLLSPSFHSFTVLYHMGYMDDRLKENKKLKEKKRHPFYFNANYNLIVE